MIDTTATALDGCMGLVKTRRLAAMYPPSPLAFTFALCAAEDKMADIKRLCLVSKGDRNRRIGEFLKELDLAEARNTGYPVILGATKTNGSPKPILETNTHRDYFTFVLPIHEMFLKSDAETVRELNMADPVEGVNGEVNEGVKILLAAIRKNPGKRTNELALLIGKSVQTVERYVKKLKAASNVGMWQQSESLAAKVSEVVHLNHPC